MPRRESPRERLSKMVSAIQWLVPFSGQVAKWLSHPPADAAHRWDDHALAAMIMRYAAKITFQTQTSTSPL